jgi:hypothetical protein
LDRRKEWQPAKQSVAERELATVKVKQLLLAVMVPALVY